MGFVYFGVGDWFFSTMREVILDKVEQLLMCSASFRLTKRLHGVMEI